MYKVLLISNAYSLTAHSSRYKLSIIDKVVSLNLDPVLLKKVPSINIPENKISPAKQPQPLQVAAGASFLFILGFFLGDGTLHLKLDWKQKNSTVVINPLFNIIQSNVESNKQIMVIMTNTLNSMGIKTKFYWPLPSSRIKSEEMREVSGRTILLKVLKREP